MRVAFMQLHANVVRFPVERRVSPSLAVLRHIAPEASEIAVLAEVLGVPLAHMEWRLHGSEMIAACIDDHILPTDSKARLRALGWILQPFLVEGIQACRHAEWFLACALAAQLRCLASTQASDETAASAADTADAAWTAAAEAFVLAYQKSEEAEGAAQHVGLARPSEIQRPFDDTVQARAEKLRFGAGPMRCQST